MKKSTLIEHINGLLSRGESDEVMAWIEQSERNEKYYMNLYNTVIGENLSKKKPFDTSGLIEEKEEIFKNIKKGINKEEKDGSKVIVYRWVAIAAVVLLFVSIGINFFFHSTENNSFMATVKVPAIADVMITEYTDKGLKSKVMLPDSSLVWMNSDSKITFPKQFDSDVRRILFEGEGFFEVHSDSSWPFEVTTAKGMKVKAMGTKFHISSYRNNAYEEATLFSGKIIVIKSVKNNSETRTFEIEPLETVDFPSKGEFIINHSADTLSKVAWKSGMLLFDQTPMSEVVKILERWHGIKIIVNDPAVYKNNFTASFNSESLVQILELLKYTSPTDYSIDGNTVYLFAR